MINDELKEYIKREIAQATQIPVGAIFAFPSEKIPEGFLPCEGQELSRTQYPELFTLIGTAFGGTIKTFCLPDLQGQFIRGLDRDGNIDYDSNGTLRNIGSIQLDSLQGHRHKSYENSNGGHDHKVYVDSKNRISYGTNTFSSDNTADLCVPRTPSNYEANKNSSAYNFGASVETTYTGSHTHGFAVLGVTNDTYGETRISSETRPKNMALIFCIKVL